MKYDEAVSTTSLHPNLSSKSNMSDNPEGGLPWKKQKRNTPFASSEGSEAPKPKESPDTAARMDTHDLYLEYIFYSQGPVDDG